MAGFEWPSAWPVAKDRVECVFQADKYAGVVKSMSKNNKTMRVWFDDNTKHTWKCESDKTWEIIQRYVKPKVSFFVCAALVRAYRSNIYFLYCSGRPRRPNRNPIRRKTLGHRHLAADWLRQGRARRCRYRRQRKSLPSPRQQRRPRNRSQTGSTWRIRCA